MFVKATRHHGHLRVWRLPLNAVVQPLSPHGELRQLSLLVEDRDKLVVQKIRLQNQLRSTLGQYFPQAVKAFSDITTQTALEFLEKFPFVCVGLINAAIRKIINEYKANNTFSKTQGMTDYEWNEFLDKNLRLPCAQQCGVESHLIASEASQRCLDEYNANKNRCFHPKARKRFLEAMKLKPIIVDDAVVKAKSLFVTAIVGQLSCWFDRTFGIGCQTNKKIENCNPKPERISSANRNSPYHFLS